MIELSNLRLLVERHWAIEFTDVPTRFAGATFADDRLPAWAELWVLPGDSLRRRWGGPEASSLSITVHLFSRNIIEANEVEELADSAKRALFSRELGDDTVRISVRNFSIRDLSREGNDDGRPLRHLVIVADGMAEEICSAAVGGEPNDWSHPTDSFQSMAQQTRTE